MKPRRRAGVVMALGLMVLLAAGCDRSPTAEPAVPMPRLPMWPTTPVTVNEVEAVIEAFWDPTLSAGRRWVAKDAQIDSDWESHQVVWDGREDGPSRCEIERPYDELQVQGFSRLVVRLRGAAGVTVDATAVVDGEARVVFKDHRCDNTTQEVSGPIGGATISGLKLSFQAPTGRGRTAVQLRWVLLAREGERWRAPENAFDGMIVEDPVGRFEPGLGIALNADDVAKLRERMSTPACAEVWAEARRRAWAQAGVEPERLLRQFSLYNPKRFGRTSDETIDLDCDGLSMAVVGLVDRDEELMRQAARHAVVLARIERWNEGFIDGFPGGRFGVGMFAQALATSRASLLLDLCWDYLTPDARTLIRGAIREKGMLHLRSRSATNGMMGLLVNRALILGYLARVQSLQDPRVQSDLRFARERLNRSLDAMITPDGGCPAGTAVAQSALLQAMLPYHALARALGSPTTEDLPQDFRDAAGFVLEGRRTLPPALAAFCAGPLGDRAMTGLCVADDLFQPQSEPILEPTLLALGAIWAPSLGVKPRLPAFRGLATYEESGWVFLGGETADGPSVTFSTGMFNSDVRTDAYRHSIALSGWGESLLLHRRPAGSEDARSEESRRTVAFNTITPGLRQQDANGNALRGAKLAMTDDVGPFAVVESDNATAWQERVRRGQRRLVFVRPNVLVVEDTLGLTTREAATQNWNTLGEWAAVFPNAVEAAVGEAGVRLTCVLPAKASLTVGDGGVHRDGRQLHPVRRAAFVSPEASTHRVVTVVEAIPPSDRATPASVRVIQGRPLIIEITQGEVVTQIATGPLDRDLPGGVRSDGSLTVATTHGAVVLGAATFDAGYLAAGGKRIEGAGYLKFVPARSRR